MTAPKAAPGGPLARAWQDGRQIAELDGIRGMAILLVMAFHYLTGEHHNAAVQMVFTSARAGWVGVDMFFVLSGFLITGILLKARGGDHYFRNFYMRRTLRIFPLYYGVLACIFLGGTFISELNTPSFQRVASEQVWLWGYASNWHGVLREPHFFVGNWIEANHFWSLAVEEQFYLVWPSLVVALSLRNLKGLAIAVILFSFAFRVFSAFGGEGYTLARADGLMVGVLVALVLREATPESLARIAHFARPAAFVLLLGWLTMFVALGGFDHQNVVVKAFGISLTSSMFGTFLLVTMTLSSSSKLAGALRFSFLRTIGKYSYALYIFHWALNPILLEPLFPVEAIDEKVGSYIAAVAIQFVLKSTLSFGIAVLSWHLFEKHFLKLKKFFDYRPAAETAPL